MRLFIGWTLLKVVFLLEGIRPNKRGLLIKIAAPFFQEIPAVRQYMRRSKLIPTLTLFMFACAASKKQHVLADAENIAYSAVSITVSV